jgi:hypothetical protein
MIIYPHPRFAVTTKQTSEKQVDVSRNNVKLMSKLKMMDETVRSGEFEKEHRADIEIEDDG